MFAGIGLFFIFIGGGILLDIAMNEGSVIIGIIKAFKGKD